MMTVRYRNAIAALLALCFIGGCSTPALKASGDAQQCRDPRPQMCTREYRPVCASRDSGVRCVTTPCPSMEWRTYGNACDACSDKTVSGYRDGACPQ